VCGSRAWKDRRKIRQVLQELPYHAVVAHGGARGADLIAKQEAEGLGLRTVPYPVDATLDGPWPAAGIKRNTRMVEDFKPEFAFAFRSAGRSNGTDDCFRKCKKAGANSYMIKEDSTELDLARVTGLWWQQLTLLEGE